MPTATTTTTNNKELRGVGEMQKYEV
jgi:hypothetical protein